MSINSNLQFALPDLPPGIDPALLQLLSPMQTAVYSLFVQLSDQLGQTYIDPSLYSSIPIARLARLNGARRIYKQNNTGGVLNVGTFVYLKADNTIAASGTTSATAPIGFLTGNVANGSFGEIIFLTGYMTSSGLTPGAKFQAGAAGALTPLVAGTPIAIALSATELFVAIPIY